ncbi:hypothetical protein B0T13DRAFT_82387 [Neurospora crassa]|nr:hypothetical protein B0T13DRAFT_82387 [Neurospora crassa]
MPMRNWGFCLGVVTLWLIPHSTHCCSLFYLEFSWNEFSNSSEALKHCRVTSKVTEDWRCRRVLQWLRRSAGRSSLPRGTSPPHKGAYQHVVLSYHCRHFHKRSQEMA